MANGITAGIMGLACAKGTESEEYDGTRCRMQLMENWKHSRT